jgi:delta 1-pyrroline-5-carboxylate dehydrogenase
MTKIVSPQVAFSGLLAQVKQIAPEIVDQNGQFLNLLEGRWQEPGTPRPVTSPIDGTRVGALPILDHATAQRAVVFAKREASSWAAVDLDERRAQVQG